MKPAILLRRRFDGTTAYVNPNDLGHFGCGILVPDRTYDFIDDTLVGVEVEGQTRVAGSGMSDVLRSLGHRKGRTIFR